MSQSSSLDIDALLAPISEEQPCGTSKDSGENSELVNAFSELRDLTQTARRIEAKRTEAATLMPAERANFFADYSGRSDGPEADPRWNRIAEMSCHILASLSKDTRVMLSLVEAMPRIDGMVGLRDAMRACTQIIDRYKLTLFPLPEEGETEDYCLQFLSQIANSKNIESAIDQMEVFLGSPHLTWFSYLGAKGLEKRSEQERNRLVQDGVVSLEDFQSAIIHANPIELQQSLLGITEAIEETQSLDRLLSELCNKKSGLGISPIIERLQQLQNWFKSLVSDRIQEISTEVSEESNPSEHESRTAQSTGGSLTNREQALASLLQVAAYFRRTEPHSPLSYALEQAVRWGKMPLPELLRDLVSDSNVLSDVYRRMGIQESSES